MIKAFMPADSKIHLIIATAFGMGINCQSIASLVIHWGLPSNTEEYVQETGRAGHDGSDVKLFYSEKRQDVMLRNNESLFW